MVEQVQESIEVKDIKARQVINDLTKENIQLKSKVEYLATTFEKINNELKDILVEEAQSKEQDQLLTALGKCLGEMHGSDEGVERTGTGNRGNCATLTDLANFAMPFIAKYGLSFRMEPIEKGDSDYLRSVLGHSSGQWTSSTCKIRPDYKANTDPNQEYGKSLTYMKKYVFGAYFNLHTGSEK